jgi:hypothetical protein
MSQPAIIKVKIKTGTLAEWVNANPILLQGEFGFVIDDKQLIIGDGTNAFLTLYDSFHRYNQIASVESLEQVTGAFQTSLGNEITNRTNADNDLQNAIDDIIFDVTTINGTLTSHDTRIIAVETLIANFDLTLTAKGQILVLDDFEGKYIPLQVGANGYVLTADDTNSSGISWSAIPNQSIALDDLTDVNAPSPNSNDVLLFDAVHNEWTNQTLTIPSTLDDLSDVIVPSPSTNDVLKFNGSNWINSAPIVYGDMFKSTYDVDNDGIVDSSEKMLIIGRNSTGATLYQGIIVYISGSTGNRPNFVKAQANAESTSAGTFGVVVNDITNNSDGYVCTIGTLHNLDTRINASHPFTDVTLSDGDTIYLHPTIAGYVTNVKPSAPNHLVYIGKVIRTTASNGTIVYRIQNGYELKEIHDVQANSPANNDLLYYDSSDTQWKTKSINNILGYTPANITNAVASVGASSPIASSGGLNPSISIAKSDASTNGYLASTDFNTFNNKQNALVSATNIKTINSNSLLGSGDLSVGTITSVTGTSPIISSGGNTPAISIGQATTSANGYISSTDFNTFNNKFTSFAQFRKSGRWYNNGLFPPANAGFTNQLAIRFVPFFVDADITISRLGINVLTIAPASSTCRLGIYTNDASTCQPLTKIYGTGTLAIDSIGAKNEIALSIALTKGLYWMAYVSNANSGSITGIGTNAILDVKGQSIIGAVGFAGFNQTFTYGALPTSAGTLTEVNSGGTICIWYYY